MKSRVFLPAVSALAIAVAATAAFAQGSTRAYSPVTDAMIQNPPASEWLSSRGTVDNQGYSPLDQINRENVGNLELAWAWALPELGRQESAPLYHDGILFVATNNNHIEALDAVTGDLIWRYMHTRPEFQAGYHNNQAMRQKNTIALYENMVIQTTVDARLMAHDALTGEVLWDHQVHDWEAGFSYTSGPTIANGMIFTGVSGCSMVGTNGACWITAHDANTGEELWRFNTLNDPNNPEFEASWGGVPLENRWGATPWAQGAYDFDLNLVYFGTGMPIPYAHISRGTGIDDDVLYTNSTIALDADTGQVVWYYQHLANDNWDLDHPFERILIDAEVNGETRRLVVSAPGKTMVTWGLDAATGEFVWVTPTLYTNVYEELNRETGEIRTNRELMFSEFGQQQTFCPAINGGRLWMASAYSPRSGLFYVHGANTCQTIAPQEMNLDALPAMGNAMGYISNFGTSLAPGYDNVGAFHAVRGADGEHTFEIQQGPRFNSGVLATGGGLIFVGDVDRYYFAMNDETGEVLWQTRLHAPAGGYPMTYEADGVQYLVLPVGLQTNAFGNLMPELQVPRLGANAIYVFRLRG